MLVVIVSLALLLTNLGGTRALHPDDQAILADVIQSLSRAPAAWSVTDVANACKWSFIECTANQERIMKINVRQNVFAGSFPCQLFSLPGLNDLVISNNPDLSGSLNDCSSKICSPTGGKLEGLILSDNGLYGGSFPDVSRCNQTMRVLILPTMGITGTIPEYLTQFSKLTSLYVHNNKLTGTIPPGLFNLPLDSLFLSNNKLYGELPSTINNAELIRLHLRYNLLEGPLPDWMFSRNWSRLSLSHNAFQCPTAAQVSKLLHIINGTIDFFGLPNCHLASELTPYRHIRLLPIRDQRGYPTNPTIDYSFGSSSLRVELIGRRFFVFAVDQRTNKPFRDEYLILDLQGITKLSNIDSNDLVDYEAEITGYDHIEERTVGNGTVVELSVSNLIDGATFNLTFELGTKPDVDAKFSIRFANMPNLTVYDRFLIGLQWTVWCTIPRENINFSITFNGFDDLEAMFTSSTFNFSSILVPTEEYGELTFSFGLNSRSRNFQSAFLLPVRFVVNENVSGNYLSLDSMRLFLEPFGQAPYLNDVVFVREPPQTAAQSFAAVGSLVFQPKTTASVILYDPDISLGVLFDIVTPPDGMLVVALKAPKFRSSSPGCAGLKPGEVAGIVLGTVAIIAIVVGVMFGVKSVRDRILPYSSRKARQLSSLNSEALERDEPKSNSWVSGAKPTSK